MVEQLPNSDATGQPDAPIAGQPADLVESRPLPRAVEDAIRDAAGTGGEDAERGVLTLAAIANRAVAELNKLARAEANMRRGTEDWGAWASLANSARDAVLKMATCRKVAVELFRRKAASS